MKINKDSRKYYKEIRTIIPSRGKYEKRLLKTYEEKISELNENKPEISYEELHNRMGDPTEIINDYYDGVDTAYLIKRLRTTKCIRTGLLTLLIAVLIVAVIYLGVNYKIYYDIVDALPVYQEITIE
ncbi:MAG: hypothetical protein HFH62_02420 [Lachnospiraceae bacterium]|nr:hypothetical protein [Lachnospiraceae bacterium]